VPVDPAHRVASGVTGTIYQDSTTIAGAYYVVTGVNATGEGGASNTARSASWCGRTLSSLTVTGGEEDLLTVGAAVVTRYYYLNGQRIAQRRGDMLQYLVGDHLGSTSLVMDDAGNRVAESRHYPYGEERWREPSDSTFPTDYRFTGQRLESYINLYTMGARQYDPVLGRWVSPDAVVPQPENPQALNRYSYTAGNPLIYVDPSGHVWFPPKTPQWKIDISDWIGLGRGLAVVGCFVTGGCHADLKQNTIRSLTPEEATDQMAYAIMGLSGPIQMVGGGKLASALGDGVGRAGTSAVRNALSRLVEVGLGSDEAPGLVQRLAQAATRNKLTKGGTTLLGSFPEYIDQAKLEGLVHFDMPTEVWETLRQAGDDYVWAVNKQFLDDAIAAGNEFVVVLGEGRTPGKWLIAEIEYLLEKGYQLIDGVYVPVN
jgi:RHS repeat-associated protein